jgi:hypothetical protein
MRACIPLLAAVLLTPAVACAQSKTGPAAGSDRSAPGQPGARKPEGGAGAKQIPADRGDVPAKPAGLHGRPLALRSPDAIKKAGEAKGKLPGVRAGVVKFDSNCRPGRVSPGSSGTIQVLMAFAGNAVMLDPPPVTFKIEPQQGFLTVDGPPSFQPPEPAGLAPALKGLPAYDNYAIFEVPFGVADDAPAGTQHLDILIRYEVLDGVAGGVLGTFTDRITADVEVAATAAEAGLPANAPLGSVGGTQPAARGGEGLRGSKHPDATDALAARPLLGNTPELAERSAPAPAPAAMPAVPPPQRESPATLLAVGSLALGVIVLLILRRRR